jgi:hypothetical protein
VEHKVERIFCIRYQKSNPPPTTILSRRECRHIFSSLWSKLWRICCILSPHVQLQAANTAKKKDFLSFSVRRRFDELERAEEWRARDAFMKRRRHGEPLESGVTLQTMQKMLPRATRLTFYEPLCDTLCITDTKLHAKKERKTFCEKQLGAIVNLTASN